MDKKALVGVFHAQQMLRHKIKANSANRDFMLGIFTQVLSMTVEEIKAITAREKAVASLMALTGKNMIELRKVYQFNALTIAHLCKRVAQGISLDDAVGIIEDIKNGDQ